MLCQISPERAKGKKSFADVLGDLPESVLSGREWLCLELQPGCYRQKLDLRLPKLRLRGTGARPEDCLIDFADGAKKLDENGEPLGTFRTPSLYIEAEKLQMENLTVRNSAGPGKIAGQAVALSLNCREAEIVNCRLEGDQDTLFLAPLPEKALQKNGFRGSEGQKKRAFAASVFESCYIEGGVDFVFGSAAAWFEKCELRSLPPSDIAERDTAKGIGYIAAPSTPQGQRYGFVFNRCLLVSDCPPDSVYLARPWRDYARAVFIRSELGGHIKAEGWHDWGREKARREAFFAEGGNSGAGASTSGRVSWGRVLDQDELSAWTLENFRQYVKEMNHEL